MDEKMNETMDALQDQAIPETPEEQAPVMAEEATESACYTVPMVKDEYVPAEEPTEYIPEQPVAVEAPAAPAKTPKKLNKKLFLAIIGGLLAVAVVIALIAVLTSGPKSTGLYLKDGEIYLFVKGMDEPVELSSRLAKGVEAGNLVSAADEAFAVVRNDGKRIFFPDKVSQDGFTLCYQDVNKLDDEPVKIDSDVQSAIISEDGNTVLYMKGSKRSLHLYDVKKEEETKIDSGVVNFWNTEDMTRICYRTDDGKVYIWTAETEGVKVAKDASVVHYYAEEDMLFVLTTDGELQMKSAEMEEAEEIADNVTRITACYASGEVYFVRESTVERQLMDYFDDDMKDADASLTKPKTPNYPSAPRKPYYWNYDVYADYEEALAEYNTKYAEYQETYNKLKEEYNKALDLYYEKEYRDEIRFQIEEWGPISFTEYALYLYNGTDEVLLSDTLTSQYAEAYASDAAVLVYETYLPQEVPVLKITEVEDYWGVAYVIMGNISEALYNETEIRVAVGSESTAIEQKAASNFVLSDDGAAIYLLDAPFAASDEKGSGSYYDAPAAEAPVADAPAATMAARGDDEEEGEEEEEALLPEEKRAYAGLYKITVSDGQVGAPELIDEDVSIKVAPSIAANGDLVYYKDVSQKDQCGELYINGQAIADDVKFYSLSYHGEYLLFYTDWDVSDKCGTLCMLKQGDENAEIIEVDDDICDYAFTSNGELYFLQDYNWERYEGTLYLYNPKKGEGIEIDDDVIALLNIN